jgi:hypothetical protein
MIHYLVPESQAFGMAEYLDFWGEKVASRMRVVTYEEIVHATALPAGTWILSALDQLSPAMSKWLGAVEDRLEASGRARTLNSTRDTHTRLSLLEALHARGINPFRARNAADPAVRTLRYPVFVREEHGHGGALTPCLESPEQLERAIRRMMWSGWHREQLLVVEFHDTVDEHGFYRKYAAFIVGDRIIPRSLAHGRNWMLKHRSGKFTREAVEEERAYVEDNPHATHLAEIARIAGVEWGRVDYAMDGDSPVVWEINLNPTIGRGRRPPSGSVPAELRPLRDLARERFYRDFLAAFEAVDLGATGEVPLDMPADGVRIDSILRAHRGSPPLWVRLGRPLRSLVRSALRQ